MMHFSFGFQSSLVFLWLFSAWYELNQNKRGQAGEEKAGPVILGIACRHLGIDPD